MIKFKKFLAILLFFTMVMFMGVSCSKTKKDDEITARSAGATAAEAEDDKETDVATEVTSSGADVTLKTVSMFGGTDSAVEIYGGINEQFMADHPNITIADNSQSSDEEWKATVAADFAVGNEPDVLQFFTDATANDIVATGKLVSLEEIQAEYPEYAQYTTAAALEAVANTDGVQRAVPTVGYWEGLYINKDIFDEYNVEIPIDWGSLVKAIEIFNENNIIPIAVSLNEVPHYWVEFLMLYTSGIDEYTAIQETAPESWVEGLELFQTLRDLGAFSEDTDTIDNATAEELFNDKKAAMQLDGNWRLAGIPDQENTMVVNFPGVPNQSAEEGTIISGVSSGFYITRKAWDDPDKREAAVKFVMAHTTEESLEAYWGGNGVATYDAKTLTDMTPLARSGLEFSMAATNTVQPTDARIAPEAYKTIIAGIAGISAGVDSAEDILNSALELSANR